MSVRVILRNAAVVAAGLCCSICNWAKEEYMSGQLGRDIMSRIYLVITRSWQMFPVQQCLMFKIFVSRTSGRRVPLLLADRRRVKAIAELCKMRPFLQAGQESSVISPRAPCPTLLMNSLFPTGFVAAFRRYPTKSSRSAETAWDSCLIQHIQGVATGKQLRWALLWLSELCFEQMPTLPCTGGPKFGLPGETREITCFLPFMGDLLGKLFWAARELYT